ncbi:MAG: fused MFS/spermidine synthase [Candidatus Hydrogenedentes bacterium]|nr:fused MFS/spermidine synthase [Candidatus Hydrogenedentota bacterium]
MAKIILLTYTFTSGAAVMLYEFLAVRFLQRYFGSVLEVWASVIAVCLAGLALGYAKGGRLADQYRSWRVMGALIAAGGFTALFMEPLAEGAGNTLVEFEFGRMWHPLAAATISSFLPILFLGTIMPQAVRLYVDRLDAVGVGTGRIAAISTVGSIAGTLLTVHALLPYFGVREILIGASILLILMGSALVLWGKRPALALVLFALCYAPSARAEIVFEKYSAYHHILVEDGATQRRLRFDNAVQSTVSLRDPYRGGFEYTDFFHVPVLFHPTMTSALFLGLGGGTGPKAFLQHYPNMRVEVAEIDPMVVTVARKYFAVPEHQRLKIAIEDARTYVQRSPGRYGTIIMDAYASSAYGPYVPYHLATQEFFQLVRQKLDNGGSFVFNVVGVHRGHNDAVLRAIHATLQTVFQYTYAFQARTSWNTVLVAVKLDPATSLPDAPGASAWPNGPFLEHPLAPAQLQTMAQTLMAERRLLLPGFERRVTQASAVQALSSAGKILTDNYAPVDLAPKNW